MSINWIKRKPVATKLESTSLEELIAKYATKYLGWRVETLSDVSVSYCEGAGDGDCSDKAVVVVLTATSSDKGYQELLCKDCLEELLP